MLKYVYIFSPTEETGIENLIAQDNMNNCQLKSSSRLQHTCFNYFKSLVKSHSRLIKQFM